MEKFTIYDAFKTFELEEEKEREEELSKSFNLNDKKEVIEAGKFLTKKSPEEETLTIVDVCAEDESEMQKSYVGEIVLQCPVCNTLISKKEIDIQESEENETVYNVGEECPQCHNESGFTLVGKLAPMEEIEGKEEIKVEDDTDSFEDILDLDDDIKIKDSYELEDALKEDTIKKGDKWVNKGKDGTHGTFKTKKAADAQRKAMFASGYRAEGITEDLGDLSEEEVKVSTDTKEIKVEETDDGKVKVESKDKVCEECAEVEVQEEPAIETVEAPVEEIVVDTEIKPEDAVFEIETESLELLVNKFLMETYENVKDYKLTKSTYKNTDVFLEGVITFKSGTTRPTKFILQSSPFKKLDKIKLVGINESFSNTKKSFVITGRNIDNKFVCESFSYSYSVKTLNEGITDTKKVSGRITLK